MKILLYMAVSADGFVARADHDTSWVSATDWENFGHFIKEAGIIVMGRKTYEVSGQDFPYPNAINIVLTHNENLLKETDSVIFTNRTPGQIVEMAKNRGFNKLLLIGGGITNTTFLKENLIDEIILSVHPIILGSGIKLFENTETETKLKMLGIKELPENLLQLRYEVIKE